MAILSQLAATILARSGRRCCICRRFLPTRIQVHHILPVSEGGSDEPENLIALCLTCHADVHSKVPFTRRFSSEELRLHREQLFDLVANGRLPSGSDSGAEIPLKSLLAGATKWFPELGSVPEKAVEIIVAAARSSNDLVTIAEVGNGAHVQAGEKIFTDGNSTRREIAACREAVEWLHQGNYIRRISRSDSIFEMTHSGYLLADELESASEDNE